MASYTWKGTPLYGFFNYTTHLFNEPWNCSNHQFVVILTMLFLEWCYLNINILGNTVYISSQFIVNTALHMHFCISIDAAMYTHGGLYIVQQAWSMNVLKEERI